MKFIKLPTGRYAAVDDEDYSRVKDFRWQDGGRGYVLYHLPTTVYGQPKQDVRLHHCIIGFPLAGKVVDHINRDKLDNRKSNLRIVTKDINCFNSKYKNTHSGYRGVTYCKRDKMWRAHYSPKKQKQINLGWYFNKKDAINARHLYEQSKFGQSHGG